MLKPSEKAEIADNPSKELVEMSKSVGAIATLIENIAGQIRQQLEAVQTTAAGVAGCLGEVSEGSAAIAAAVEEQSVATQEIVSNINTTMQGVEQINGGIFAIKDGTDSTTTSTQQVLEAARTLSGQATQMDSEVKNLLAA